MCIANWKTKCRNRKARNKYQTQSTHTENYNTQIKEDYSSSRKRYIYMLLYLYHFKGWFQCLWSEYSDNIIISELSKCHGNLPISLHFSLVQKKFYSVLFEKGKFHVLIKYYFLGKKLKNITMIPLVRISYLRSDVLTFQEVIREGVMPNV